MSDLTEIWVVAVGSGLAVGLLGLLAVWSLRHRSLRWQLAVVGVVTTLTVLVGVQAISRRMLIIASQKRSSSPLSSLSVGSTISVPATGNDTVGA